jgi:hypothetical protein
MQYKILRNTYHTDLSIQVNHFLNLGWEALGGISICNGILYQAIIKK